MHKHPPQRFPDVFVHGGRNRADHPAVSVAAAHLGTHLLRLGTVPEFVPRLRIEVAHDLLILCSVTGHDVAVRIDKEGIKTHIARKKPLLSVNIIDKTVIEIGTEPLFGAVGIEKLIDEILKILCDHRAVMNDIFCLNKIEAVMQGRRGEFHVHLVGQKIQRDQIGRVLVLDRHTEADILHSHVNKRFQRRISTVESVLQAADLIVSLLQPLDRDADPDLRKLFAQVNNAIGEKAVGGNDDAVALFIELTDDLFEILTDEGLSARDIGKVHPRELLDRFDRQLFLGFGRRFIAVAHRAPRVTTIRYNDCSVEFLFFHISPLSSF